MYNQAHDPHEVEITTKDYTADFTFGDLVVYGKAGVRDADLELPRVHETNADIVGRSSERVLFKGKIDDNGDIVDGKKIDVTVADDGTLTIPDSRTSPISEIWRKPNHSICQRRCNKRHRTGILPTYILWSTTRIPIFKRLALEGLPEAQEPHNRGSFPIKRFKVSTYYDARKAEGLKNLQLPRRKDRQFV